MENNIVVNWSDPRIFLATLSTFNGAPGYIQGNIDRYEHCVASQMIKEINH